MQHGEGVATLALCGLHVHGEWIGAKSVGAANLIALAHKMMEWMDVGFLVVEAAPCTTRAGPGHRPRAIRFTRRADTDAGRQADGPEDGVGGAGPGEAAPADAARQAGDGGAA